MVIQILDMSRSLSSEIVRNGHHFVGSLDRLGVNLVTSLGDDHIDHFFGEVDIRTLQESLLDRPKSGREAACPLRRRSGGKAIDKEIVPIAPSRKDCRTVSIEFAPLAMPA